MTPALLRVDRATLAALAALVPESAQRDEMAAPSYLHGNPLIRWLFWRRLAAAADLLGPGRYAAGLDFGCGLGLLLPTLAARTDTVYATDLELRPARKLVEQLGLSGVHCLALDALDGAVPDGALDYVIATDVLEHVPDLRARIARFAEQLRPGGRLIMSGPTETRLYRLGRLLAGFAGKEHYHHTDVFRIRAEILGSGAFALQCTRVLPVPRLVPAFVIDAYVRR